MELSPLLIAGIVLLAVVAGLTLWQRRQQVDQSASGRHAAVAAPPAAQVSTVADETVETESSFEFATDPLLGAIAWDEGIWSPDDDPVFAGTTVLVEVHGPRSGLTESQRSVVRAALEHNQDLDTRARATIRQELDRRGVGDSAMEPYSLEVKPGPEGGETAYLWYDVAEADREMGVSSTDRWRTLALEFLDQVGTSVD